MVVVALSRVWEGQASSEASAAVKCMRIARSSLLIRQPPAAVISCSIYGHDVGVFEELLFQVVDACLSHLQCLLRSCYIFSRGLRLFTESLECLLVPMGLS